MRTIIFALFFMMACGQADLAKSVKAVDGAPGKDGTSCFISDDANGKPQITCGNRTEPLVGQCSYEIDYNVKSVTMSCQGLEPVSVPLWNGDSAVENPSQSSECNVCQSSGWHFEQIDNCLYAVNGDKRVYIGKVK